MPMNQDLVDRFEQDGPEKSKRSLLALWLGIIAMLTEIIILALAGWAAIYRPPLLNDENFAIGIGLILLIGAVLAIIGLSLSLADIFSVDRRSGKTKAALLINLIYLGTIIFFYIFGSSQ